MSEEERNKLYEDAVTTWGVIPQLFMVFEETGELLSAIAKHYRGRNNPEDVVTVWFMQRETLVTVCPT